MYKALSPGAIRVSAAHITQAVEAARIGGFAGVEFNPFEIADLIDKGGIQAARAPFAQSGIRPAGWGLPVDWRGSEETWREGVAALPRLARAAAGIGSTRCMTWVMPGSDERDMAENARFHIARFRPIAEILGEHGCSLGLEFIGPKTIWGTMKYPFAHTMVGMLELGEQIAPNVGLLLDCWHWYTSHGTVAELDALTPEQVVYVHVNDAPKGIPIDEQVDNTRDLPGATGVIDIQGFLRALKTIGYDGPVTPEPFLAKLSDLPSDEARLTTVGASMDQIMAHIR